MEYIRFDTEIASSDRAVIDNLKFFLNKSSLIVLRDIIDIDKRLEISIRPADTNKNFKHLRVTIEIKDSNNKDDIIIMPYIETVDTYIKIYKVKHNDTMYVINLKMEESKDIFMNTYQQMLSFKFMNQNIIEDINYFNDIVNIIPLNNDIELMKFVCAILSNIDKLDDKLIELIKEKLSYYGYDENSIEDDMTYETDNNYKINAMNYLLRKLYDIYDDVDKDKYLEENDFLGNIKSARDFFDDYMVKVKYRLEEEK